MPTKNKIDTGLPAKLDIGQRVGKLTVIGYAPNTKWRERRYVCLCLCGKEKTIIGRHLRKGITKSCGCLSAEVKKASRMTKEQMGMRRILLNYRSKARDRDLCFELSEKQVTYLVSLNCHYCNKPPSNAMPTWKDEEKFIYNGIDRIDNSIGYVLENCVSCCDRCNTAKSSSSKKEFEDWIDRIYNHMSEKKEFKTEFEKHKGNQSCKFMLI